MVKYKLKALCLRVLIYKALQKFIWHDRLSSSGPITVSIAPEACVAGVKTGRGRKNKGVQEREERARRGK